MAAAKAAAAQPLAQHRRPTTEEREGKVDNVNFIEAKGGNRRRIQKRAIAGDDITNKAVQLRPKRFGNELR